MALKFKPSKDIKEAVQNCIADSDTSDVVKAAFLAWISNFRSKKRTPESIVNTWDMISEQLLSRKLTSVTLWEITNQDIFKVFYKKVINDKLFRVTDRKTYYAFGDIGELYLKFLKSKSVLHKAAAPTVDSLSQPVSWERRCITPAQRRGNCNRAP